MKTCLLLVLLVVSPLAAQAAETPDWLTDLQTLARALGPAKVGDVADVHVYTPAGLEWMPVPRIKVIALAFETDADLRHALEALPTKARRDNAYTLLIGFTRWQPKPAFTDEGMQHGGHPDGAPQ